ncbi:MAG: Winged helix DNA-binding protein [Bacteroidetes bacterium]|nr:Winged helix DNA-binding protein [Bacteroidota bacterium]
MTIPEVAKLRLINQQLAAPTFTDPAKLVSYLGAVQAQDYAGSKWALGLRLKNSSEIAIEKAINDGKIIRTHLLRPTWHYVAAADIKWMLQLSAPRVNAFNRSMYRKHGLDDAIFKKTNKILIKTLQGNKHLTRTEIAIALQDAKIVTDELRLILLLMHAELDGIICNGIKQEKQFTYTLLDERVPGSNLIKGDEALAELAKKYFISRGPATVQDFIWWSGLSVADAKKAVEIIKPALVSEIIDSKIYWMKKGISVVNEKLTRPQLLPAFDEYTIAYKDRSAALDPKHAKQTGNGIFSPQLIIDGKVSGTWKRTLKKDKVNVEINPFIKLTKAQQMAIDKEIERYADFLGLTAF